MERKKSVKRHYYKGGHLVRTGDKKPKLKDSQDLLLIDKEEMAKLFKSWKKAEKVKIVKLEEKIDTFEWPHRKRVRNMGYKNGIKKIKVDQWRGRQFGSGICYRDI